jgi:hypothetical protein
MTLFGSPYCARTVDMLAPLRGRSTPLELFGGAASMVSISRTSAFAVAVAATISANAKPDPLISNSRKAFQSKPTASRHVETGMITSLSPDPEFNHEFGRDKPSGGSFQLG